MLAPYLLGFWCRCSLIMHMEYLCFDCPLLGAQLDGGRREEGHDVFGEKFGSIRQNTLGWRSQGLEA